MDRVMTRTARFLALGGVSAIAFGIIVLFWPGISLAALTALFGAFAFVYGSLALGVGLTLVARKSTDWVPYVVGGIAGIVVSAITFLHPAVTLLVLTYLVAAWALVIGAIEVVAAIDVWNEVDGAAWLALGGALSIIFGVVVAIQPGAGLLAILWVIGVYAILGGLARLIGAYRIHRLHSAVKNATPGALRTSEI